jgi:hypothetical protein
MTKIQKKFGTCVPRLPPYIELYRMGLGSRTAGKHLNAFKSSFLIHTNNKIQARINTECHRLYFANKLRNNALHIQLHVGTATSTTTSSV